MQRTVAILGRVTRRVGLTTDEAGQDLIEYSLLVGLIAIVALVTVSNMGQMVYDVFWAGIAASL